MEDKKQGFVGEIKSWLALNKEINALQEKNSELIETLVGKLCAGKPEGQSTTNFAEDWNLTVSVKKGQFLLHLLHEEKKELPGGHIPLRVAVFGAGMMNFRTNIEGFYVLSDLRGDIKEISLTGKPY